MSVHAIRCFVDPNCHLLYQITSRLARVLSGHTIISSKRFTTVIVARRDCYVVPAGGTWDMLSVFSAASFVGKAS